MAVPGFQTIMRPLLALAANGKERKINECISMLANELHLSDQDRAVTIASGKQTVFANRVHWARTYLDKAGAIKKTRRSHFQITDRGRELLKNSPTNITVKILKQFRSFSNFIPASQVLNQRARQYRPPLM